MKILVVEDNYNKVQEIHNVFKGQIKPEIKSVRSSSEAKYLLEMNYFDLLIVDVQIPDIEGGDISPTGGIDLLSYIETASDIKVPSYIMGLTSHSDDFDKIKTIFEECGWPIFNTKSEYDVWSKLLLRKFNGITNNIHNLQADVAILTALEHTELEAVLKLNCKWEHKNIDGFDYYLGSTLAKSGEAISLVTASSDRMGVSAASALTTRVGILFKPKLMVMTGICAGVKTKVQLGDIIVADHVWDWSSGKITEEAGEMKFLPEPHQLPLDRIHRSIIKSYTVDCPFVEDIYLGWQGNRGTNRPKVHLAPMACGSQVIANVSMMDQIMEGNRKMLALEMESYGFLNACETLNISAFVSKSICDFADSEKADDNHDFAAYTSSSFALNYIINNYRTLFR
jgi:nucleoside phosphorylase/CheY-like chemotaxis protein